MTNSIKAIPSYKITLMDVMPFKTPPKEKKGNICDNRLPIGPLKINARTNTRTKPTALTSCVVNPFLNP
ncbi:hypothetical protein D3C80_1904930 [compost metagenome]